MADAQAPSAADGSGAGTPDASIGMRREILVVLPGLLLAIMLAMLDQLIVGTALPRIVGSLGGVAHLSWVVTAYVLASTITTPLYGKLGDMYGRKKLFMAAIVVFLVGSALAGLSQTMAELIAFRAVQGLGAGGLMVSANRDHRGPGVTPGAWPVHGLHHGRDDDRHDRRTAARRLHHRQLLVALDLLHQPADRRRRPGLPGRDPPPAEAPGRAPGGLPGRGHPGRGDDRDRAGLDVGRHRVRVALAADRRPRCAGRRGPHRFPQGGGAGGGADPAAAHIP